jgi:hypothetical protein
MFCNPLACRRGRLVRWSVWVYDHTGKWNHYRLGQNLVGITRNLLDIWMKLRWDYEYRKTLIHC